MLDFLRKIYLKSIIYDKKISKNFDKNLHYKPSVHLLTSIIKVQTKKFNINDFSLESVWINKKLDQKKIKKLNNFFWLLSLDLRSSNKSVQSIIKNWLKINFRYKSESWDFNTTSKRLISWLSNSKLTYDDSNKQYKKDFDNIIQKQAFHLINQIEKIEDYKNKLVGISAIILVGLCYNDYKNFTSRGLAHLKKIIKNFMDNYGFPKSRNIKSSIFFLKYLILIRDGLKNLKMRSLNLLMKIYFILGSLMHFFGKI